MAAPSVQEALATGDIPGAIEQLKAVVRKAPTEPDHRFLLFQLFSVAGDWRGAANQLGAQRKLLAQDSPFLMMLEGVVTAELTREQVFRGGKSPKIMGEPPAWIALFARALSSSASGRHADAAGLRKQALESAPSAAGTLDDSRFQWLMDADSRLGPVLELIINASYYWTPQSRIRVLEIQPPEQPRDLVWAVARITLDNGTVLPAHLPARYPMAATWPDDALRLSRGTDWDCTSAGSMEGRGQKMWISDVGERAVLDARRLEFIPADTV